MQNYYRLLPVFGFAFLIVIYSTWTFGLGIAADSVDYIYGAKNILEKGLFLNRKGEFINHYPPLYSYSASLISYVTSLSIQHSFWVLNAIIAGVSCFFASAIAYRQTKQMGLSYLFGLFVLTSSYSLIYFWNLTEGLFSMILWFQLFIWSIWNDKNSKGLTILLGVTSALLLLTRFAGVPFFLINLLFVWLRTKKQNWLNSLYYIMAFIVVIAPWFIKLNALGVEPTSRSFFFHPIRPYDILRIVHSVLLWITPMNWLSGILLFLSIGLLRKKTPTFRKLKATLFNSEYIALFAVAFYTLFIIASRSFFDAHIQLDQRIFSPLFPYLFFLVIHIAKHLNKLNKKTTIWLTSIFLFAFVTNSYQGITALYGIRNNGLGYKNRSFQESRLFEFIEKSNRRIYTNFPKKLYINAPDKDILELPIKYKSTTTESNSKYGKSLESVINQVRENKAYIVLLPSESRGFATGISDIPKDDPNIKVISLPNGHIIKSNNP